MLKRDYILSLIEQFAKELAVFLSGKSKDNDFVSGFEVFYKRYLHKEASFFYENDLEAIRLFMDEKHGTERLAAMEMLAELLFHDAPMHLEPVTRHDLYMKSLALFEWLDEESKTYSAERLDRIALIRLALKQQ